MREPSHAETCCPHFGNLPTDIKCFMPDIKRELKRLLCRQTALFTKRRAILRMAEPRLYRLQRYIPKCPCMAKKLINIERLETRQRTRTEQLSYPSVRRLLLFKERVKGLYPPERINLLNRLIRYSLLSLYSRLQNALPPQEKEKIPKWDETEWKTHTKYLKKLATPKKAPSVPKLPTQRMPLKEMKRFKSLAIPKQRYEYVKEDWKLTPAQKAYTASEAVQKLAQPNTRDDSAMIQELPKPIEPSALKYKATDRIKELAAHRDRGGGQMDLKENPFGITPNALKAKASKRTQELAEPKEYENTHIRENPFAISPAALKAKATPRLIELAKPKGT